MQRNESGRPHRAAMMMVLGLAACGGKGAEQQAPMAMPPQDVQYEVVTASNVAETFEFVGNVQPFRRVEVRSPVSGIITKRPFVEGAEVKVGDVLYEIDRTVYTAAERSADARLKNAERQVARLKPLLADKAVAQRDLDDAETELLRAKADYDRTRKDLDDATVRAEINGRVGRTMMELGGRVTGPGDLLTTIDQLEPVYVSFRPSSQQLMSWRQTPASAVLLRPGSRLGITVTLPDGSEYPRAGKLDYVDPVLEQGTGTQEFRATFANPDRTLVPGQFVRVKLAGFEQAQALTVPQRAVQQQMGRRVVYIVGPGDTVQVRDVEVGSWTGDRWIIKKGLQAGDKVITDGVQKTGPGAVVKPTPAGAAPAAPAAGGEHK